MSLAIDVDTIARVLLADGWHNVTDNSFTIDAYEFLWSGRTGTRVADLDPARDPLLLHGGGNSGVCATGFAFTTTGGKHVSGPLTAVLAVEEQAS
jgi:hypothetical protein